MLHQIKIIDIQGYEFQGLILQQDLSVAKLLAMALCKVVYIKYAKNRGTVETVLVIFV